jgi:membrane-associated phospholipid phosphatase
MTARARFWTAWSACLGLWLAGFALLAPHDLTLSRTFSERTHPFGVWVFRLGELPGWLAVALALGCLLTTRRPPTGRLGACRPLAWQVLAQALAHPLLVTQAFKFLWGRVRPLHLDPGAEAFTPLWLPAGPGAGESFPSGHVAMSVAIAPLAFWLWRRGQRLAGGLALAGVLLIGLTVAAGRVVSASHFPTDAWFSLGLGLLLAPLWGRLERAPAQAAGNESG